jgi:rhomboid protease GluP
MEFPAESAPSSPAHAAAPQRYLARTLLSRAPRAGSAWPALALLGVFAIATALHARGLADAGVATYDAVFRQGEWWRLFTALAIHDDLGHLLSNSVFFLGLGILLNGYFGHRIFPALSLLAGALTHALTLLAYSPHAGLVGASGMVYFMAAFWLTLHALIQRDQPASRRMLIAAGVGFALLFPTAYEARTSYLAHAIGFGLGVPLGLLYFARHRAWIRSAEAHAWRYEEPEPGSDQVAQSAGSAGGRDGQQAGGGERGFD